MANHKSSEKRIRQDEGTQGKLTSITAKTTRNALKETAFDHR